MTWLARHLADYAVPQTDLSTQRRAASHLRSIHCDAQLRWAARHAASALRQQSVPRLAHGRQAPSACHAQPSAESLATPLGSPIAVTPEASTVSQAGSIKTFDVVHLGNLCLDIIVPLDELPSEDTGAPLLRCTTCSICPATCSMGHRIACASLQVAHQVHSRN